MEQMTLLGSQPQIIAPSEYNPSQRIESIQNIDYTLITDNIEDSPEEKVIKKYIYCSTESGNLFRISIEDSANGIDECLSKMDVNNIYGDIFEDQNPTTDGRGNLNDYCGVMCTLSLFSKLKKKPTTDAPKKPYITTIISSANKKALFVGDSTGGLKQISLRRTKNGEILIRDYGQLHTAKILSLCIDSKDRYLYTCSQDGYVKKINLLERNHVEIDKMWQAQKIESVMINLYWTKEIKAPISMNTMLLSHSDSFLYIGTQEKLFLTINSETFEVKQSNIFFKNITCISERTDNFNIFAGTEKGSVYEIYAGSLLAKNSEELMAASVMDSIHRYAVNFMVICTHNDFLFTASKVDGVIL
jgi:hypothetical protein